jgi:hypothetical protein
MATMVEMRTLILAAVLAPGVAPADSTVPFPAEYRTWAVTRTLLIGPESKELARSGGLHHYYANGPALEGFRSSTFPRGAIIVDERLETREVNGVILKGECHGVAVMMKNPERYRDSGGWGFDRFADNDRTDGADGVLRSKCFACHVLRKDADFVFSKVRE